MKPRQLIDPGATVLVDRQSAAPGQAERRRKVMASAAQHFSEKRYSEVHMDEIAQTAEVAKGTLYTYFADKEELYFAVVFDGISKLNEDLKLNAGSALEPEEKLRQIVHGIISFLSRNRGFFRLMAIEDSRSEGGKGENRRRWREERGVQLAAMEAVLRNGNELGVFAVGDPRIAACVLRDMVRSVMINSRGENSTGEMADTVLAIFMDGVRVRATARAPQTRLTTAGEGR